MAYRNLYTPLSQFVDPMSTEIAEELRNRFLTNYKGASDVQLKMAELRAAPFDSDRKLRDDLIKSTMSTLTGISQRGDYENMTVPVMNAAQRYATESAPIDQNYQLYNQYQEEQKALYEKGEIDYEQYMGNIGLSKQRYTGLSKDQTGNYSNYFTGVQAINTTDEKIQERMHAALNGIVAEEFGKQARIVGVNSANGQVLVLDQGEIKTVSKERVSDVMDMIMSDRQIRAYMMRKGQIRASNLTYAELLEDRESALLEIDNRVRELQELKDKTNQEERKALIEEAIQNQLSTASTLQKANDENSLRSLYAVSEAAGMDQTFRQAASSRYATYSETSRKSVLPEWAQMVNGGLGYGPGPITAIPGRLEEIPNPSGSTFDQLSMSSENQAAVLSAMEDPEYMQENFQVPLTGSEIADMTAQEFAAQYPGISSEFFKNAQAVVLNARATQEAIDKRVEEVRATLGISVEQELSQIQNEVEGAGPAIKTVAARLNVSEEEAYNLIKIYYEQYQLPNTGAGGNSMPTLGGAGYGSITVQPERRENITGSTLAELDKIFRPNYVPSEDAVERMARGFFATFGIGTGGPGDDTPRMGETRLSSIVSGASRVQEANIDKIDDYLEKNSYTQTSFPTYDNMPFGFRLSKAEKASLDGTFKQGSPAGQFAMMSFYDASGTATTFEKAALSRREAFGDLGADFDPATATLKGVRYSPYDYGTMGATMIMSFEDENDQVIQVPMPLSQINNTGIDRYLSSNINKFANIVGQQYARQVENIIVPLKNPATGARYRIAVDIGDSTQSFDGAAYLVDDNGNKIEGGKTYTLGELTDPNPQTGLLMVLERQGFIVSY